MRWHSSFFHVILLNKRTVRKEILLALLFITAAAYGTRAYFTDNALQDSGIALQVGNLSIDPTADAAVVWKYSPIEGKVNSDLDALYDATTKEITNPTAIRNVQPGDAFTGTFTFKNTGTLTQVVTAENDFTVENGNPIFDVAVSNDLINNTSKITSSSVTVKPGETVSVQVMVSVKTDNSYNSTHNSTTENPISDSTVALTAIEGALTVTAVQSN